MRLQNTFLAGCRKKPCLALGIAAAGGRTQRCRPARRPAWAGHLLAGVHAQAPVAGRPGAKLGPDQQHFWADFSLLAVGVGLQSDTLEAFSCQQALDCLHRLCPAACSSVKPQGHLFGVFKTAAGRWRRMDVIMCAFEEHSFCVLGWTGSRQWLRFLRNHAAKRGMLLNSHRQAP